MKIAVLSLLAIVSFGGLIGCAHEEATVTTTTVSEEHTVQPGAVTATQTRTVRTQ